MLGRYLVMLFLESGITISGHRYSKDKEELEKEIEKELKSGKEFILLGGDGGARASRVVGWTVQFIP